MAIFAEIRNECLIRELKRELNTDVLLFGFDGFTYFGNLQAIEEDRLAVLSPAIQADSTDVEVLSPGGELAFVEFARVDLWQIVGKGTGIVSDPLDPPGPRPPLPGAPADPARQESHCLIRLLTRLVGDEVGVTTLGGFLFEGIVSAIADELAILTVDDVFVPGTSTSISDTKVRSVVINLEAITSVLGRNTSNSQ